MTEDKVEHDLFGITDEGKRRDSNEDAFLIVQLHKSAEPLYTSLDVSGLPGLEDSHALLFVVADGVKGSDGGQLASRTAVEVLGEHVSAIANGGTDNITVVVGRMGIG